MSPVPPALLACLSAVCFGVAVATAKLGLRTRDARAGAAISIPTATALFVLAAPFRLEWSGFQLAAAAIFAIVGLFFPAAVTLLTFESTRRLGPVPTSALSSTAPVFAVAAAWIFLGESVPVRAFVAAAGVALGVTLLSWRPGKGHVAVTWWTWGLPLSGALLRAAAQVLAKAGLALWPNPFAAGLVGYLVSSATVFAADRIGREPSSVRGMQGAGWFVLTGMLNGGAVLLMYVALASAPVSLVAPIVATYPLVTIAVGAVLLRDEALRAQALVGALLVVASIVYLVSR